MLFFGEHGTGEYCYGEGSACGDPADQYKQNHAYPYKYQVWAYDANDLVDVRNGRKRPYEVKPYAVLNFDMPFVGASSHHEIGGAAYDPATDRIYLAQPRGDGDYPVVHVYKLDRERPPSPLPPSAFNAE